MVSPMTSPVNDDMNMLSRVQTWAPQTQAQAQAQQARQQQQGTRRSIDSTPTARRQRWSSTPDVFPQASTSTMPNTTTNTPSTNPIDSRRRSSAASSDGSVNGGSGAPNTRNAAKRAAHNVIEKRYRTNMNSKFVALEKAMSADGVDRSTKGGSASLKKSEILSNAIAYIQELQEESQTSKKELALLKQNILTGDVWKRN